MRKRGCTRSAKMGIGAVVSSNDTTDNNNNDGELFSASEDSYSIFTQADVCAARDGTNHLLMTWNAELIKFDEMLHIYRIITPNNPENTTFNDIWYQNDAPTKVIDGLGKCYYAEITAKEGNIYEEWVDSDSYEGYYVMFLFVYSLTNGNVYGYYMYCFAQITNYCIADAPSLTYNQSSNKFSIGTSMSGRRILEFHRNDIAYGYPTSIKSEDTLNEMLFTAIIDEESDGQSYYSAYRDSNENSLNRWAKGTYTVGVNFKDNTNKSRISSAINSALSEINSVLNSYGVYFTRNSSATSGDITIIVGSEYDLFGINLTPDAYVYGGKWDTNIDSSGYITSATIQLANDFFDVVPYNTYEQAAMEELAQAMGAGYDQYEYITNTLHTEFNYLNKPDYLTTNDKNILKLVYSDYAPIGEGCTEVSKAFNIPKGVYMPSASESNTVRTVSGSFLDAGASYSVRVFIVNSSGQVSYTSDWISITTPDKTRPADWEWTTTINSTAYVPMDSLGFHPVTAVEWNNFTTRINEFREYTGYSDYSFTTVSRGQEFTPAIYNQAVNAIKGISGYGTYLSTISSGTKLTANLFLSLRDELNAIP